MVNDATADANMFLILGALRGFNKPLLTLREGQWRGNPLPPVGRDPRGKTLGILGMGGIGRNLRTKAEAFGMRVIYHNRTEDFGEDVEYVSFEELLSTSDVISLNLPLNVSKCLPQPIDPSHRQDTLCIPVFLMHACLRSLHPNPSRVVSRCLSDVEGWYQNSNPRLLLGKLANGYADKALLTGKHSPQDRGPRIRSDEEGCRNCEHGSRRE